MKDTRCLISRIPNPVSYVDTFPRARFAASLSILHCQLNREWSECFKWERHPCLDNREKNLPPTFTHRDYCTMQYA